MAYFGCQAELIKHETSFKKLLSQVIKRLYPALLEIPFIRGRLWLFYFYEFPSFC